MSRFFYHLANLVAEGVGLVTDWIRQRADLPPGMTFHITVDEFESDLAQLSLPQSATIWSLRAVAVMICLGANFAVKTGLDYVEEKVIERFEKN